MRIDIMTLFPEFVDTVLAESIIGRARKKGILDIRTWQIRDYSRDKHRRVDDTPYGGGKGLLMAAPPIYRCYEAVMADTNRAPDEREVPDPALDLLPDTTLDDRASPVKDPGTYVVIWNVAPPKSRSATGSAASVSVSATVSAAAPPVVSAPLVWRSVSAVPPPQPAKIAANSSTTMVFFVFPNIFCPLSR